MSPVDRLRRQHALAGAVLVLFAGQVSALVVPGATIEDLRSVGSVLVCVLLLLHVRTHARVPVRWAAALADAGGFVLVAGLPRWWPGGTAGPDGHPRLSAALPLASLLGAVLVLFVSAQRGVSGGRRSALLSGGLVALAVSSVLQMLPCDTAALSVLRAGTALLPVVLWGLLLRRQTGPATAGATPQHMADRPGAGRLVLFALLAASAPASLLVGAAPVGSSDVVPVVVSCALLAVVSSARSLLIARQLAATISSRDQAVERLRTLAEAARGLLAAGDLPARQRAVAAGAVRLLRDGGHGHAAAAVAIGHAELLEVVAVDAIGLPVEQAAGFDPALFTDVERTQLAQGLPVQRTIASPDGGDHSDGLLALPLRSGPRAVGALVLAAPAPDLERARPTLDVYALQASSALASAPAAVTTAGNTHRAVAPGGTAEAVTQGLRERQFVCHYQPIVDLASGAVAGFEALVRWEHPERGLLLPEVFLPAITAAGLLTALDNSLLVQACSAAMRLDRRGDGPYVSVNLSAGQLMDEHLVDHVRGGLARSGLPPWRLQLEVTESASLHRPELAAATLARLRALRVRIAFDDFGTGHSSLSWLHQLPLDVVKVDKSFVDQLPVPAGQPPVVAAVTAMSHVLGLDVVAEGVETVEQRDELQRLGVRSAQGWLWSKALPETEAARFLHGHRPGGPVANRDPSSARIGGGALLPAQRR